MFPKALLPFNDLMLECLSLLFWGSGKSLVLSQNTFGKQIWQDEIKEQVTPTGS